MKVRAAETGVPVRLRPAQTTQVFWLAGQTGASLPEQYEMFLTSVGCGEAENGTWLAIDPFADENVVIASAELSGGPAHGLLVVFSGPDGLYGFLPVGSSYSDKVHVFSPGARRTRLFASSFSEFLDLLCEEAEGDGDELGFS